jgi:preprotein translocase subunit SecA
MVGGDEELLSVLAKKEDTIGKEELYRGLRIVFLQLYDQAWIDHLETMEHLRRTVNLRAYGQRDPLVEYRKEGLRYFKDMESGIDEQFRIVLPRIEKRPEAPKTQKMVLSGGSETTGIGNRGDGVRNEQVFSRNDMVTITDGKETHVMKYKKAEPLLAQGWKIVE